MSDTIRLTLRCNPSERRVWVERGEGSVHNIAFSSTFDAVIDASDSSVDDSAQRLHDAAIASAISSCLEGELGVVLSLGSDAGKRTALLQAVADHRSAG